MDKQNKKVCNAKEKKYLLSLYTTCCLCCLCFSLACQFVFFLPAPACYANYCCVTCFLSSITSTYFLKKY